jgi:hypothetical protein
VVIEELLPEASAAQRAAFSAAVAVLTTSGSSILPKVFRLGPTMFVREHVTGKAISELAGCMDVAAVRGLHDLCQSVVALHRRGIACGGLPTSTLIVPHRKNVSVMMVDWRRLVVRSSSTADLYELRPHDRDEIADARSLVAILSPLFATPRWPDASKLLGTLVARRLTVEADLERVAACLGAAVCTLRCRVCNTEIRMQDAFVAALGYTCRDCAIELSTKGQSDYAEHMLNEERRVYRDRHRKLARTWIPLTISIWLCAFIAEWYMKDGARIVFWIGGALTAKSAYHRISARELDRALRGLGPWRAPGWLVAIAWIAMMLVMIASAGATVAMCAMSFAVPP